MKRAAVLIGVDRTGDLPRLRDAARGARLMAAWARMQGMDPVELITDETQPVSVWQIKQAITRIVQSGNVAQLLVYFAGHGVNIQRQEYWLLSDAPDDTQAAVNVTTSAVYASTCSIAHIVLISDACRTAPEGIRAQSVRGSEIFPNREADTMPVDIFYGCQLGKPSLEIRDPDITSGEFHALYTGQLVPALSGQRQQIVAWDGDASTMGHVHLRPLRDYLSEAVSIEVERLQLHTRVIQVPVATISSDPPAWISHVAAPARTTLTRYAHRIRLDGLVGGLAENMASITGIPGIKDFRLPQILTRGRSHKGYSSRVRQASPVGDLIGEDDRAWLDFDVGEATPAAAPGQSMDAILHRLDCGFVIRGRRLADVHAPGVPSGLDPETIDGGTLLRMAQVPACSANVLLVLQDGSGVLLPAIPSFVCRLEFDDDELIDVAYEPSALSGRWEDFEGRAADLRRLRTHASHSMSQGAFQLDQDSALKLAARLRYGPSVDPALAVYAAYAWHDLHLRDLTRHAALLMREDLGAVPFDVALLGGAMPGVQGAPVPVLGPFPLISQGWTLMQALGVTLPAFLQPLHDRRLPSLWTLFDDQGVGLLRQRFRSGDLS